MLITNLLTIGNNFLHFRKKAGLTQAEVAERAGISDRTYADIERGAVNLRIETLLKLCQALEVTPNDLLVINDDDTDINENAILEKLLHTSQSNKTTALKLLNTYLSSLN